MFARLSLRLIGLSVLLFGVGVIHAQEQDSDTLIELITSATEGEILQTNPSPAGGIQAQVIVYPCVDIGTDTDMSYEQIIITDENGENPQTVAEQLISCGGLGASGLQVMRWSLSGTYMYFTGARKGQPDGMAVGWAQPIERVNIAEMQTEVIGSAHFSPNGQQLVMWNSEQVGVMDVEQPLEEAIWFDYVPSLGVVYAVEWLPTADRILYI